jgi:hypothetical protein
MASSGETTALLGSSSAGDAQAAPFPWKLLLVLYAAAALAWCAVRVLAWAWWRPRRLGRVLRSQGLRGTAYRSLAGDARLTQRLNREARSRPMPLGCHDVAPRAMPLFHHTMKEHGTAARVAFLPCWLWLLFLWARTRTSLRLPPKKNTVRGQLALYLRDIAGQSAVVTRKNDPSFISSVVDFSPKTEHLGIQSIPPRAAPPIHS